ncbi:MAG: methyltransferase domain-containing protein [Myxococcales bacterium]|nr:methyltransferase domain-containing protein [Myxococcales bacterium]
MHSGSLEHSETVERTKNYYDSNDADAFYQKVWGGEDIHIGLYGDDLKSIVAASRRTVESMATRLRDLGSDTKVLDIGSGYCGAARVLAKSLGVRVVALNLSVTENERARKLNEEAQLADRIDVIDGAFEALPFADASFDAVWSQDAILHSGDRKRVFEEVSRVLKPGGRFVFTDPMQADDCPPKVLQPILDRIHLEDLASPTFYRGAASSVGLVVEEFQMLSEELVRHYTRVREELIARKDELQQEISADYLDRMARGLTHWIEGGTAGHLAWGIFCMRKA